MLEALIAMHSQGYSPMNFMPNPPPNLTVPKRKFVVPSESSTSMCRYECFDGRRERKEISLDCYIELCKQGFRPDKMFEEHIALNQTQHFLELRENHPDYVYGAEVDEWIKHNNLSCNRNFYSDLTKAFPGTSGLLRLSKPVILERQRLMVVANMRSSAPLTGRGCLAFYHLSSSGLREVSVAMGMKS